MQTLLFVPRSCMNAKWKRSIALKLLNFKRKTKKKKKTFDQLLKTLMKLILFDCNKKKTNKQKNDNRKGISGRILCILYWTTKSNVKRSGILLRDLFDPLDIPLHGIAGCHLIVTTSSSIIFFQAMPYNKLLINHERGSVFTLKISNIGPVAFTGLHNLVTRAFPGEIRRRLSLGFVSDFPAKTSLSVNTFVLHNSPAVSQDDK